LVFRPRPAETGQTKQLQKPAPPRRTKTALVNRQALPWNADNRRITQGCADRQRWNDYDKCDKEFSPGSGDIESSHSIVDGG
jgi:hypothetical protein